MITNIQEQLERDEGRSLVVYPDQFGNPTIGIGHKLLRWEHFPQGITSEQCDQLFNMDLMNVQNALRQHLPWVLALDDPRLGVVENMTFNMGISPPRGLLGFTHMLGALQEHDFSLAAAHMMNSLWAKQVPDRAKRLETQMIEGTWQ